MSRSFAVLRAALLLPAILLVALAAVLLSGVFLLVGLGASAAVAWIGVKVRRRMVSHQSVATLDWGNSKIQLAHSSAQRDTGQWYRLVRDRRLGDKLIVWELEGADAPGKIVVFRCSFEDSQTLRLCQSFSLYIRRRYTNKG